MDRDYMEKLPEGTEEKLESLAKNRKPKPDTTDLHEYIVRHVVAFDELEYVGRKLAKRMAIPADYENAEDALSAMIMKAETLLEELELMHGDACNLEHSDGDNT